MLMYLYGADTFRRSRALRGQIIPAYTKKHSISGLLYFDGEDKEVEEKLAHFSQNNSLFVTVSLGVLTAPEKLSASARKIVKRLLENEHATLVVVADKKLPKKEFGFLYDEAVKSWEFSPLTGKERLSFIKKEAKELGAEISDKEIVDLSAAYDDLWGVVTELSVLALGGTLSLGGSEPDFFTTIKSLRYGRSGAERLVALDRLVSGDGGAAAFNMYARFVDGDLKRRIADYDVLIKSGRLEYAETLLDLAL